MDRQIVLKIACGLLALFIAWSQRSLGDDGPQRLGPQRDPSLPDLSKGWKFKIGDDATWSVPSLDDSSWQPIRVGRPWESQGHVGYDGYAWYRIHFRVPEKLQNQPEVEKYQSLRLALGKIDDVDQTWLNGKLIGSTGNFSDPYGAAWQTPRVYHIPVSSIRWHDDNVLAVRVYDGDGRGGMYAGDCGLMAPTISDFLRIDFDLGRGDGIFLDEDGMPITARLRNKTTQKCVILTRRRDASENCG